jgi:hypothetical protein
MRAVRSRGRAGCEGEPDAAFAQLAVELDQHLARHQVDVVDSTAIHHNSPHRLRGRVDQRLDAPGRAPSAIFMKPLPLHDVGMRGPDRHLGARIRESTFFLAPFIPWGDGLSQRSLTPH